MGYILSIFLLFQPSAFAWQIKKIEGEVSVNRSGEFSPAHPGFNLEVGDVIKTGRHAKAQLAEGQSFVWIGQRSFFRISKETQAQTTTLQIDQGKVRFQIDKPESEKYSYKLKNAVAGVRGTEFFAEVNDSTDRLCILEGEVEVVRSTGERIVIPAGQGVALRTGENARLVANSSFLVGRWVAETSFDSTSGGVDTFYAERSLNRKSIGSEQVSQDVLSTAADGKAQNLWFYGARFNVTVLDLYNLDLENSINDPDVFHQWWYFSPFVQYGKSEYILARPSINLTKASIPKQFDKQPVFFDDEQITLSFVDLYFHSIHDSFEFLGGAHSFTWHDGVLISDRTWSSEPTTYTTLKAKFYFDKWDFEIFGILGDHPTYPLDGFNQVDFIGASFGLGDLLGDVYALYANLPSASGLPRTLDIYYNREMFNLGYINKFKYHWLDYKLSTLLQKHVRFPIVGSNRGSGYFVDFEMGANFGSKRPLRYSVRQLLASRDFSGIQYDYYLLGQSFYLKELSNINQLRTKLEWQVEENHLFSIEYLYSRQVTRDGLFIHRPATKDNLFLGSEIDLNYRGKICASLTGYFSYFMYFPSSQIGGDPAKGFFTRFEWDF